MNVPCTGSSHFRNGRYVQNNKEDGVPNLVLFETSYNGKNKMEINKKKKNGFSKLIIGKYCTVLYGFYVMMCFIYLYAMTTHGRESRGVDGSMASVQITSIPPVGIKMMTTLRVKP